MIYLWRQPSRKRLRIRHYYVDEYGIATQSFISEIPYDDLLDVGVFFEITPDGNEIRIGINSSAIMLMPLLLII